jgi:hypothetical protein
VEVYSKLYYSDRILPAVKERVKAESGVSRSSIAMIRKVTKQLFEGEDDEVKAEVAAKMAIAQELSLDEETEENVPRTPQQFQE